MRGLEDKNDYYYRGAYADCICAIDFLESRPEVDSSRIAINGTSQGGGLSLAIASLDKRIIACAPDIPFLCNFARYFQVSDWPEYRDWLSADPNRTPNKAQKVFSYFDTINMVDKITCPVFMGIGLQDETCPAGTIFVVYNKLKVPKSYRMYPDANHWVESSHYVEQKEWLLLQLGVT